ncbi:membrane protein insertion efficiency factor YidD [Roseateles violae]|uniref:Putative membrane protein insertion efficiency factor n=1 Tax=Roseateles violae TaxID=3058042 RepID=A0ABT8DMF3_9BURK|nr:membrane protein insertion efficiency factor YidD [Pelomonas sp. PFR6]MDN3919118.1 membrane protein insertion efficiency factor YidD [Pelomonas sp. PFR6]
MAAEPGSTLIQSALIGLVRGYRLLLSPWLGASCRFEPTCSVYAIGALQRHGAAAGGYLAAARILRCNPFCAGGHDGVPDNPPALFRRLLGGRAAADSAPSSSSTNPEASS